YITPAAVESPMKKAPCGALRRGYEASSIAVNALPCLAPQPPGGHVFLEQLAGTVLAVAEFLEIDLHHREAHVQSHHVRERQRPDWLIAAQLHARVDVLGRGQALGQHEKGLVDHGHEN